ncbi:hypothetical protein GCK32_020907 [Trichostrongylus colubriformis]|uniref:Uncharacterized protein n=1 Tax=Trichostrongylus colubriformis TaxID=6319 RepID=A0AAN8FY65_TRICO
MEMDQESQQPVAQDDVTTAKQESVIHAPPTVPGFSTPQQSRSVTDMTDLTKTFTRRAAMPAKDISPVLDNSVKADGVSPRN